VISSLSFSFPCGAGMPASLHRMWTRPYLTLPYLRGGQVVTPAQRWGRISSAQCAAPM